ncbi:MAG TPA: NUDIX hydrolase [Polyangiaceae bacterium]|jgi:8-oxo-dGTP pyrophosphatase MutT (NUDIX family)|nr:NUDIX hydrolase [Polyangiaceae bacterium]
MEKLGPWTRRSVVLPYENPWIRVEHHDVVTPSGTDGIYGVVHFKNLAIGIIPIDENGDTWLVGQYRYPHRSYSWEIPEGGGRLGDDPRLSAERELAEEVGLRAGRWDLILSMELSNSVTDEQCHIYLARDLEPCSRHPDETEELALRRIPFDELHDGVLAGQYRDSLTVAGVLKLKALFDRGLL